MSSSDFIKRGKVSRFLVALIFAATVQLWPSHFSLLSELIAAETTSSSAGELFFRPAHQPNKTSKKNHNLTFIEAPFTFSACLMIKDDNRLLPEWLAYHYTSLPLQHVVVALDPFSLTDPEIILDQWRREMGLRIDVWEEVDFINYSNTEYKRPKPRDTDAYKAAAFVERQLNFYTACLDHLRGENRTWTVLFDSDEYLVLNTFKIRPSASDAGTVAEFIDRDIRTRNQSIFKGSSKRPCIALPRVFFGGDESSPEEINAQVPSGFNASAFDTLRYRKYLEHSYYRQWPGKCIVDASRFSDNDYEYVENPHRILSAERCVDSAFPSPFTSIFRVQHYLGSLGDFMNRPGDSRRTPLSYYTVHSAGDGIARPNDDIRPWLQAFVDKVGIDKALRLTQQARIRAEVADGAVQETKEQPLEKSNRRFITYMPSVWEEQWIDGIEKGGQNQSVCEALQSQHKYVIELVRNTCLSLQNVGHQEYLCVFKPGTQLFQHNLSLLDKRQGALDSQAGKDAEAPLVLSMFILEDEETGELHAESIEPLVGDLRHPLSTLKSCLPGGEEGRSLSGGLTNETDPRSRIETRMLVADSSRSGDSHGNFYYAVGATAWDVGDPSIATVLNAWNSSGVPFDKMYIWGSTGRDTFLASVPTEFRHQLQYFQQHEFLTERSHGADELYAPLLIRESRSQNDYVLLHFLSASPHFNLSTQFKLMDDLVWEEHNYVDWIDELVWSDATNANVSLADAYDYAFWLRKHGIRVHTYI